MSKMKIYLNAPKVSNWNRKSRRIAKKYKKEEGDTRYPLIWRNNWIMKRNRKFLKIMNIELEVIGYENLPKAPAVITPNHSSSLDPSFIIEALRNPDPSPDAKDGISLFLAKQDIKKNKRVNGYANMLDTFYIDRKSPRKSLKAIDEMGALSKEEKRYQIIFPEGTRSKDGKVQEFKGGAFRGAKKGFLPIVPVTINNAPAASNINRKETLKIQVIFHPALKPMSFMTQDTKSIAENVQKTVEKAWVKPSIKAAEKEEKKF